MFNCCRCIVSFFLLCARHCQALPVGEVAEGAATPSGSATEGATEAPASVMTLGGASELGADLAALQLASQDSSVGDGGGASATGSVVAAMKAEPMDEDDSATGASAGPLVLVSQFSRRLAFSAVGRHTFDDHLATTCQHGQKAASSSSMNIAGLLQPKPARVYFRRLPQFSGSKVVGPLVQDRCSPAGGDPLAPRAGCRRRRRRFWL